MTVLVSVTEEEGGHVLRRWERAPRTEGRLVLTHDGGVEGFLVSLTVRDFRESPPPGTRVGFANDHERSWEPSTAA